MSSNLLTAIVLTKDESMHIKRCIENLKKITNRIIVVDSFSTDGTQEIARSLGAEVIEHPWPGNQAEQFNWALDNLNIPTPWILRLDADEYLLPKLIEELNDTLPMLSEEITGVVFKRRHIFMGKWMKHGIYPVKLLRLFRNGHARYEQRLMDEHLVLTNGKEYECQFDFCDHNLNDLSWFCNKHINYAEREAAEMLISEFELNGEKKAGGRLSIQASKKRSKKQSYSKKKLFWRSFYYFLYRYFYKKAFLDGKEGFIFSFLQGWWYRTLVDAKILEIKRACGDDPEKIKSFFSEKYNINL